MTGQDLKSRRLALGMPLRTLSKLIPGSRIGKGISVNTLVKMENGEYPIPEEVRNILDMLEAKSHPKKRKIYVPDPEEDRFSSDPFRPVPDYCRREVERSAIEGERYRTKARKIMVSEI